jgi:hypothetical protein
MLHVSQYPTVTYNTNEQPQRIKAMEESLSRTKQALALLKANPELTPYQAAKQVGISTAAVYTALKRQAGRVHCPCCGSLVDPAQLEAHRHGEE